METQPTAVATIIMIAAGTLVLITSAVSTVLAVIAVNRANEVLTLQRQFVANMSHELRTPLSAILGYADMAVHEDLPTEMIPMIFEKMHRGARRLRWLIDNALYTVTLTSNGLELEPLNLADIAHHVIAELQIMHPRAVIETMIENVIVRGHVQLLFAAVSNLLDNAIKFSGDNPLVSLVLVKEGRLAVLSVADSGIGIEPEKQKIIFDFHRQGDGSDTRRFGGVGIGLWIVQQVIVRHGGRVEVESELGQGATFRLILPVYEETAD